MHKILAHFDYNKSQDNNNIKVLNKAIGKKIHEKQKQNILKKKIIISTRQLSLAYVYIVNMSVGT